MHVLFKRLAPCGLFLALLTWLPACRGREFAKPMPPFAGAASESLIVFQSDDEANFRRPRIHFISPGDGRASELDQKRSADLQKVISEPHIVYSGIMVATDGGHAPLVTAKEATGQISVHADSIVSPDGKRFLRSDLSSITVQTISTKAEAGPASELADCDWESADSIICLAGKYQERRQIVRLGADLQRREVLFKTAGKPKMENLIVAPDKKSAVFTTNEADNVTIYRLHLATGRVEAQESFTGRYIFSLGVSGEGVIAARIVHSKHTPDKLDPYDVWISQPYGPAKAKGYLLNLPALDAPGFFSGKGFRGVDAFAFSPDGKSLALLMSGENDCRMADEGGNLACRQNVYVVEKDNQTIRQLTQFRMTSARKIRWVKFTR